MKKAPRTGGAGNEYINALNKLYSTPSRPNNISKDTHKRACQGCGIHFQPYRVSHTLCRDCYHWDRVLSGIVATRLALKELQ